MKGFTSFYLPVVAATFFCGAASYLACPKPLEHGSATFASREEDAKETKIPRLFQERSIIELAIEAPFDRLREESQIAKILKTPDPEIEAGLSFKDEEGSPVSTKAKLKLRGNSSIKECDFPKLKLKFESKDNPGHFAGLDEVKINTHCGEGGLTHLGRFADEKATLREGIAYEWGQALGLAVSLVRRARITYIDSDTKQVITRLALLIEDPGDTAKRLGGKRFRDGQPYPSDAVKTMGWNEIAKARLFEHLVGNWDWRFDLSTDEGEPEDRLQTSRLWNMEIARYADGHERPMPYDFDMASLVSGKPRLTGNLARSAYLAKESELTRYLGWEIVAKSLPIVPRAELRKARDHFASKRKELEGLVKQPYLDSAGVKNAKAHLAAFFELTTDERLSQPVLLRKVPGFEKQDRAKDLCFGLQDGSPVRVIERKGEMTKIQYMGLGCDAPEVWVESSAIGE